MITKHNTRSNRLLQMASLREECIAAIGKARDDLRAIIDKDEDVSLPSGITVLSTDWHRLEKQVSHYQIRDTRSQEGFHLVCPSDMPAVSTPKSTSVKKCFMLSNQTRENPTIVSFIYEEDLGAPSTIFFVLIECQSTECAIAVRETLRSHARDGKIIHTISGHIYLDYKVPEDVPDAQWAKWMEE